MKFHHISVTVLPPLAYQCLPPLPPLPPYPLVARIGRLGAAGCGSLLNPYALTGRGSVNPFTYPL
jgi:hypothetical protein